ncbi:hypothetical protein BKA62DRAFT_767317 [Auriculariales sp. MPI-PUGE-AT-0066]|nr:hypothetical protein BKA62DRAFT_767317 [Auriculariales sp. MPI-PUGE-AT-0066]
MVSATINVRWLFVFRYTALATGIVYGIVHKRTLQSEHDKKKARMPSTGASTFCTRRARHGRRSWPPRGPKATAVRTLLHPLRGWELETDGLFMHAVITDPEDPKFDLEKLIAKWEREAQ